MVGGSITIASSISGENGFIFYGEVAKLLLFFAIYDWFLPGDDAFLYYYYGLIPILGLYNCAFFLLFWFCFCLFDGLCLFVTRGTSSSFADSLAGLTALSRSGYDLT